MREHNEKLLNTFRLNVASVLKLAEFDQIVVDFAIKALRRVSVKLKEHGFNNPVYLPDNTIRLLENIRENESLRGQYEEMLNQCVVLLVSYFASALGDLFRANLRLAIPLITDTKVLSEDLRISIGEMKDVEFDLSEQIGEWIIRKKDISFQDMQSICRSLKSYLGVKLERDNDVNNIICAQASRHVIVHSGSIVDDHFLRQVKKATPRDLKDGIGINDTINFNNDEIGIVAKSMKTVFEAVTNDVDSRLPEAVNDSSS